MSVQIKGVGTIGGIDQGLNIVGVTTATNFKTGSSNLHSTGVEVAGVNVLGADTPIGAGVTIYNSGGAIFAGTSGVVTATAFHGSGANLSGLASREFYGFVGVGSHLQLVYTNNGADNISSTSYASLEENFFGPSGITFTINSDGRLIANV